MKIVLASDHAGYELKETVKDFLKKHGFAFEDMGTHSRESVDYPDYVLKAAEAVAKGDADRGIVMCGTGIGSAIVANKIPGIRCALCDDPVSAKYSRLHNDANVLSMGERIIGPEIAREVVHQFLTTEFEGGRHARRLDKIKKIEEKYSRPSS